MSYAPVPPLASAYIELPFLVGSAWSQARFLEIIVDKGRELALTPMIMRMESVSVPGVTTLPPCPPSDITLVDGGRVIIRVGDCDAGELIAKPGTIWRPYCPFPTIPVTLETCHGGEKVGQEWKLNQPKASVGFPMAQGEMRRITLSFTTPSTLKPGTRTLVRIFQRNDKQVISGSVILELYASGAAGTRKVAGSTKRARTAKGAARKRR